MGLHLCEGDFPFISAGDFRSGYTGRHTGAIIECKLDTKLRWDVLPPGRIGYLSYPCVTGTKRMMKGTCSEAHAFCFHTDRSHLCMRLGIYLQILGCCVSRPSYSLNRSACVPVRSSFSSLSSSLYIRSQSGSIWHSLYPE